MNNSFNNEVGNRIRNARKSKNITLAELGQKINLSEATVQRYESGKIKGVDINLIKEIAKALDVSPAYLMGWEVKATKPKGIKIPVLGKISAGLPFFASEDIIDYEEISEEQSRTGEFFCLQINGKSMEPRMTTGDVVVVRKQTTVENGEIAVVIVNGEDATIKKIKYTEQGMMLIPNNPTYEALFYTSKEVEELPVRIIGKVVELRAKF